MKRQFNVGDKVMRRNGYTNAIYTVVNPKPQTRDRVVIADNVYGFSDRVVQNNLRKLSRAELSIVNAFGHVISDAIQGDSKVSEWTKKFEDGDIVMSRYDEGCELYIVQDSVPGTRGRLTVKSLGSDETLRVSQNSLRKLSSAELSVIRGYTKLIEDVVRGN